MKQKVFILLLLLGGSYYQINAQGIIGGETANNINFGNDQQQLNYIFQQSNEALDNEGVNLANTGVFINQIGNDNSTNATTRSQISDIQLNQLGNGNEIDLNLRATVIDYKVTQQGNNNILQEYNAFNGKQLLERTVQQNGNNQNLVIHGNNSIVDKMKITMDPGSQNLIIRNTN